MANCQLRKTLSRFGCGSHWLKCVAQFMSSNPDKQSCPASLEGRVCMHTYVVNTKQSIISSSIVLHITALDAAKNSALYLQI